MISGPDSHCCPILPSTPTHMASFASRLGIGRPRQAWRAGSTSELAGLGPMVDGKELLLLLLEVHMASTCPSSLVAAIEIWPSQPILCPLPDHLIRRAEQSREEKRRGGKIIIGAPQISSAACGARPLFRGASFQFFLSPRLLCGKTSKYALSYSRQGPLPPLSICQIQFVVFRFRKSQPRSTHSLPGSPKQG